MIVHDVVQGSADWFALRIGKPTASRFDRIVTPKRLGYSSSAPKLIAELVAERILDRPVDWGVDEDTMWTERGAEMEAEARAWYEFERDVEVRTVGFVTNDAGTIGGSPDGLVGDDGGVEIKCRSAKHHMAGVLDFEPIAAPTQVQGYLWLTGRKWWDVVAYNPDLPKRIDRVVPDPEVFAAFDEHFARFFRELDEAWRKVDAAGDAMVDGALADMLAATLEVA